MHVSSPRALEAQHGEHQQSDDTLAGALGGPLPAARRARGGADGEVARRVAAAAAAATDSSVARYILWHCTKCTNCRLSGSSSNIDSRTSSSTLTY
jgi:hypothetical protein